MAIAKLGGPVIIIDKGKVVSFHYTIATLDDELIDTSKGREPSSYLHGYGGIAMVLERELAGKKIGDQFTVSVPPEEGYGVLDASEEAYTQVPKAELQEGLWFQKGFPVSRKLADGTERTMYMHDYRDGVFILTNNHPLAGVTMLYTIEIVAVRQALPMELKKCFIPCQVLLSTPICTAS